MIISNNTLKAFGGKFKKKQCNNISGKLFSEKGKHSFYRGWSTEETLKRFPEFDLYLQYRYAK